MADPENDAGEVVDDNPQGTVGESTADAGTTVEETRTSEPAPDDSFFDPKDLSDELLPAYKNMQASYTKRMQELRGQRDKIEAYDTFVRDPIGQMQAMAQQAGYQLTRAQAAQAVNAQESAAQGDDWTPQSWGDVTNRSVSAAKAEILRELGPFLDEVKGYKRENIERVLDEEAPEWRQYEDDMIALVRQHPSLADDATLLAKLALPSEVVEGRAMQKALRRLEKKRESAQVTGGSQTRAVPPPADPDRPMSFADAVEFARARMRDDNAA